MSKITYKILYIFIIFSVFVSCKTFKNITSKNSKKLSFEDLNDSIKNNYLNYKTLYFKFSADITTKTQNINFSGNIKIKKDSAILISVSPLGFEVGRALLTKDSILILNKIQNQYFYDDYDYFLLKHNVFSNYKIIESILTNQMFYYTNDTSKIVAETLLSNDSTFILKQNYLNEKTTYFQQSTIAANNFKINNIFLLQMTTLKELNIKYSNFELQGNKYLPTQVEVSYKDSKNSYAAKFTISKIIVDKTLKFNAEIPSDYAKVWY